MKIGKILYYLLIIGGFVAIIGLNVGKTTKRQQNMEYQRTQREMNIQRLKEQQKEKEEEKKNSMEGRLEELRNEFKKCKESLEAYHSMDDDASYESIMNKREEIINQIHSFENNLKSYRERLDALKTRLSTAQEHRFSSSCDELESKVIQIKNEILRDQALDDADPESSAVYPDAGYYGDDYDDDYDDYDDDDYDDDSY